MTVIRYIVFQIWSATDKILSFWTIFSPFTPQTAWKIKIFWKKKKNLEISSLYVCVPKIMFRWHTVPEIGCMTDVIVISHFGLFFPLLYPLLKLKKIKIFKKWKKKTPGDIIILYVYQKLWSDDVWFLRYGAWRMKLFFILGHFLPFYPPNSSKNQNSEKKTEKTSGDISI